MIRSCSPLGIGTASLATSPASSLHSVRRRWLTVRARSANREPRRAAPDDEAAQGRDATVGALRDARKTPERGDSSRCATPLAPHRANMDLRIDGSRRRSRTKQ